jgi:RNA polymerase sporulation-specific sigma factor
MHNRIISYVRKLKSRAEKERKSLEAKAYSDRNDEPDEILEALESNERLRRFLSENATEYERQVFALYLQKKSYEEIAYEVGKDTKSVDNAIYRVKSKIKKMFI